MNTKRILTLLAVLALGIATFAANTSPAAAYPSAKCDRANGKLLRLTNKAQEYEGVKNAKDFVSWKQDDFKELATTIKEYKQEIAMLKKELKRLKRNPKFNREEIGEVQREIKEMSREMKQVTREARKTNRHLRTFQKMLKRKKAVQKKLNKTVNLQVKRRNKICAKR